MSPERSSRENGPTIRNPMNAPPCAEFITAVPMSMIMDISLRRKHLTLVKTTHKETLLKAQKSYVKIGKLRRRPQYRIYSEKGKELIVSCDKNHRWIITWPNQPHKEYWLVEHSRYCDAVFSNALEEGIRVGLGRNSPITNMTTGKVLATAHRKGLWRRRVLMTMDKDVDVVLMTAFIIATSEIHECQAAAANLGHYAGGGR